MIRCLRKRLQHILRKRKVKNRILKTRRAWIGPLSLFGDTRVETFSQEQILVIVRKRVVGLSEIALARFVTRASRAARLRGAVNVLLTSNSELRALNSRFRGRDRPTDVLSFPPVFGLGNAFAGDVAISAEMAVQNARLLGHSPAEEIKILTLHGMLHLAGYDHERDHGEMARTEERLRRLLRLPGGLIDRNREPELHGAGSKTRSPATTMQRKGARKRVAQSASSSLRFSTARAAGKGRMTQVR
jgi:probable rRNA maturation factor